MNLFFEFLQISVGRKEAFEIYPNSEAWIEIFDIAKKQTLLGICATGIDQLPDHQRPPRDLAVRWGVIAYQIEKQNITLNKRAGEVTCFLADKGFRSCLLKGQGIALLYPAPLRRQSGDIDIWLDGGRKKIVELANSIDKTNKVCYHHVEFLGRRDVEIELHIRPSWMYSPLRNARLQRWFRENHSWDDAITSSGFHTPSIQFNAIYILCHIFRHFFDEGVGLRQLLDYYYVIKAFKRDTSADKYKVRDSLRRLGLYKFCGAVMYVLYRVFGMPESEAIVPVDEDEGCFLLDEIMLAGNFGKYDERSIPQYGENKMKRFFRRQKRSARFIWHYPEETLFAPIWTVWHWCWRGYHGYL
ncbi:nucleotidyltransferase domain-containing protein [Xylanibacter caecicola]|uniref:nucleotidyltransferase domain-containing protein n=1 Tax=Xylanibacter caecicola TaxID=2736294 RepID=UPI002582CDF4|nr:nucleotidyltransferase family protein [Xylanibacter caecicola]